MRWALDPVHSRIEFSVQHMMVTLVKGRFAEYQGVFDLDEQHPEESSFTVNIETDSVTTDNDERDAHLRSADFFDAARHPMIHYVSKSVLPLGFQHYHVDGTLSLHGVTRPVQLEVTLGGVEVDPEGRRRAGFSARGRLNRLDYGLLWNAPLESGGVMIGEAVRVEIEAQLVEIAHVSV